MYSEFLDFSQFSVRVSFYVIRTIIRNKENYLYQRTKNYKKYSLLKFTYILPTSYFSSYFNKINSHGNPHASE